MRQYGSMENKYSSVALIVLRIVENAHLSFTYQGWVRLGKNHSEENVRVIFEHILSCNQAGLKISGESIEFIGRSRTASPTGLGHLTVSLKTKSEILVLICLVKQILENLRSQLSAYRTNNMQDYRAGS